MNDNNNSNNNEQPVSQFMTRSTLLRAVGVAMVIAAAGAGFVAAQSSNGCACGDACACGPACQCGSAHGGNTACNHATRR